jgi:hypothetical protein
MSAGQDADRDGAPGSGMADRSAEAKETSAPSNGLSFSRVLAPGGSPAPDPAPEPVPLSERRASGPDRDPVTGRLLPGHTVTLKTGEYSERVFRALLPGQEKQLARLGDRRAQLIADQGGGAECGQVRLDLVDNYNATETFLEWSRNKILREGPFTSKGRTRAAVSLFLQMLDRQMRLAAMLGLDRRAHGVSSPFEYLAKAQEAGLAHPPATSEARAPSGDSATGGGLEAPVVMSEAGTAGEGMR